VKWIALQIHNPHLTDMAKRALEAGWVDQWKAAGIKVGFWGVSYGDAAKDGTTAAQLTAQYKGDFYIADNEGSYQDGEGDVSRNKTYVDAFQKEADRLGIGKIPRALSSMGRIALDHKPWIENGWDAMPQAYMNDYEHYKPSLSAQFYRDWGWPADRIHPTIGTYPGLVAKDGMKASDYAADLKAAKTTGMSFYLPESYMNDQAYQDWSAALANGLNG
jgi:hypothetical protein